MRIFKLIGALALALAFSAIAVASASAAETLWKWLPGSAKETFTGKSGKISWQIEEGIKGEKPGPTITCAKLSLLLTDAELKASSELLEEGATEGKDATLALAVLHAEGCTTLGLATNSLGDKAGIVLMHVKIHNCMIKKGHFGLLITPLHVHLEVPSTKLLIELLGSFVALIEPLPEDKLKNHFLLNIKQTLGLQEIKLCEGGTEDTILTAIDGSAEKTTGIEAKEGLLLFDRTIDKTGEEMMEK